MTITAITQQVQNKDRVNIMVDGCYRLSLDIFQVGQLGLKIGQELTEADIAQLEQESQFGKLYVRAVDYCLARPHSSKEIQDYLYKKTRPQPRKNRRTGEIYQQPGVSPAVAERVYARLQAKGYVDDAAFARWWATGRKQRTGVSQRVLQLELRQKGVPADIIDDALAGSGRSDQAELAKVIAKKAHRYPDRAKLIAYLQRQGFGYSDIIAQLDEHS